MKRMTFRSLMRGVALSALTSPLANMAMPMADAWAAQEVQLLRQSAPNTAVGRSVVPFTTFQQEQLAVTGNLPCKWISKEGRLGPSYGSARYDFLCKGGDFAMVSLYMDKANGSGDGVGKVRLLYREWETNINPNAGEALIAQHYLQHVVGRFVPAALAGDVMDAYWGGRNRDWTQGGVKIQFMLEPVKGQNFSIRRLEVSGNGVRLGQQAVVAGPVVTPTDAGLARVPAVVAPVGTQVIIDVPGIPGVAKTVPVDAGLSKPMAIPLQPVEPTVVLPMPAGVLPVPGTGTTKAGDLLVPGNAPASTVDAPKGLEPATAAELNTAPAPESKVTPVAPPELSATLVPGTADLVGGRQRAPSNFDIYNQAVELTKSVEERAQIAKVEQAKVTASKDVTATVQVTPSTVVVPALKPVPVPGTAATATGEGLGVQVPQIEAVGQPVNYNGPRSSEPRPLPQLKFVPKAVPLQRSDEVIQFEDEKSRL